MEFCIQYVLIDDLNGVVHKCRKYDSYFGIFWSDFGHLWCSG
jgi:hypothetical protein